MKNILALAIGAGLGYMAYSYSKRKNPVSVSGLRGWSFWRNKEAEKPIC